MDTSFRDRDQKVQDRTAYFIDMKSDEKSV